MESPKPKSGTTCHRVALRGMTWNDPRGYGSIEEVSQARLSFLPKRFEEVFELASRGIRIGASLTGVHSLMALLTLLAQSGHPVSSKRDNGLPSSDAVQRAADLLLRIQRILTGPALAWNPLELLGAMSEGYVRVPTAPGLGVTLDWDFVNKHRRNGCLLTTGLSTNKGTTDANN